MRDQAFFVLKIYCVPPDVNEAYAKEVVRLLEVSENDIKCHAAASCIANGDIQVGISLVRDVSDFMIGDAIWAEGEFRGASDVRAITFRELDNLAAALLRGLDGFVINTVNHSERLMKPGTVPCKLLAVTIGAENAPVTATRSREPSS